MRILLVDDHPLIRLGLVAQIEAVPDLKICGEAANSREARELCLRLKPDADVVDLMLGDEDGLTLVRELHALSPKTRLIVLSMLSAEEYGARAHAAARATQIRVVRKSASNSTRITSGTYCVVVPGTSRAWNQSNVGSKTRNCTAAASTPATAAPGSQPQSRRRSGCRDQSRRHQPHATMTTAQAKS